MNTTVNNGRRVFRTICGITTLSILTLILFSGSVPWKFILLMIGLSLAVALKGRFLGAAVAPMLTFLYLTLLFNGIIQADSGTNLKLAKIQVFDALRERSVTGESSEGGRIFIVMHLPKDTFLKNVGLNVLSRQQVEVIFKSEGKKTWIWIPKLNLSYSISLYKTLPGNT